MVSEFLKFKLRILFVVVLILVLVEDGLRGHENAVRNGGVDVLILVLVEDGLRDEMAKYMYNNFQS